MDPEPGRPIDWERTDLILMARHGYRPWELDRLTLSEYALCLQDPDVIRPPGGHTPLTQDEMKAYVRWVQSMNVLQRLEAAKRGEL